MRILARIGLVLLALAAVLIVVIALQPAEFTIERATRIQAPPDVIYPHIENLHAFNAWNPFAKMDPHMTLSYEGPESGIGASSSWDAPQMGKGRMTVVRVEPPRELEMKLEFFEPMPATNRVVFGLKPEDDATNVSWRMEGRNNFVGKAMALTGMMDSMMNDAFDRGLASLKQTAEADAQRLAAEEAMARAAAEAAAAEQQAIHGDEVPVE
jgi:uncharacterized protein YndB with AHSA1/START domain